MQHIDYIDDDEGAQLQAESEHLRSYFGDRRYQTREIDLAEQGCVSLEGTGHLGKASGEVLPEADTAQVEDRLRHIVGRNTGYLAKDHDIHEHREERRDEIPAHTEDGLLVLHRDVALNEEPNEVAFRP